jgi:hypothetical protein
MYKILLVHIDNSQTPRFQPYSLFEVVGLLVGLINGPEVEEEGLDAYADSVLVLVDDEVNDGSSGDVASSEEGLLVTPLVAFGTNDL